MTLAVVGQNGSPLIPQMGSIEQTATTPTISQVPLSSFNQEARPNGLKHRILQSIDAAEEKLDRLIPNHCVQEGFDKLSDAIAEGISNIASIKEFNQWLDDNNHSKWYAQLASFLVKLPIKAVRNILALLYNAIKIAVGVPSYLIMHPLKVPLKLAKIIVSLVEALLQPETWTKLGGSMIGSNLGYAALSGGVFGVIALGIGGGMVVGGISLGTLKTALLAQKGQRASSAKNYLHTQFKQVAEDVSTGFCLVMFVEAIHQAIRGIQKLDRKVKYDRVKEQSQADYPRQKLQEFQQTNNLPHYDRIQRNNDSITISWGEDYFNANNLPKQLPGSTPFQERIVSYVRGRRIGYQLKYHKAYSTSTYEPVYQQIPVYQNYTGYTIPLTDWQPPPLPALGESIRLSNQVMPYLGVANTIQPTADEPHVA